MSGFVGLLVGSIFHSGSEDVQIDGDFLCEIYARGRKFGRSWGSFGPRCFWKLLYQSNRTPGLGMLMHRQMCLLQARVGVNSTHSEQPVEKKKKALFPFLVCLVWAGMD